MGRGLGFTDAPVHLIPRDTSGRKATADSYHPYNLSIFKWKSERSASYILKSPGSSVGSWETARWKFQALIEKAFGSESHQTISKCFDKYRLVIGHKKILCIIVPNRWTAPFESLLFVLFLLFRLCLKTLQSYRYSRTDCIQVCVQ